MLISKKDDFYQVNQYCFPTSTKKKKTVEMQEPSISYKNPAQIEIEV